MTSAPGLIPLPTTIHHSTTRLTHSQAHTLLSNYLSLASTNPSLHPDAFLTTTGVQSSSTSTSSLSLQHLQRILIGIEGKHVLSTLPSLRDEAREARKRKRELERESEGGQEKRRGGKGMTAVEPSSVMEASEIRDDPVADQVVEATEEKDGWMDKDDYEHAQVEETLELDMEQADPSGIEGRQSNKPQVPPEERIKSTAEKDSRKEEKKRRKKEDKRQREEARKVGS